MSEQTPDVATDTALRLIGSRRRRRALQYLHENGGDVSLEALAGVVTRSDTTENRYSRTGVERPEIELHHNHLPKLAEHEVVEWSQERGIVTRGPAFDTVEALLALLQRHSAALPTGYRSVEA